MLVIKHGDKIIEVLSTLISVYEISIWVRNNLPYAAEAIIDIKTKK